MWGLSTQRVWVRLYLQMTLSHKGSDIKFLVSVMRMCEERHLSCWGAKKRLNEQFYILLVFFIFYIEFSYFLGKINFLNSFLSFPSHHHTSSSSSYYSSQQKGADEAEKIFSNFFFFFSLLPAIEARKKTKMSNDESCWLENGEKRERKLNFHPNDRLNMQTDRS